MNRLPPRIILCERLKDPFFRFASGMGSVEDVRCDEGSGTAVKDRSANNDTVDAFL